MKDRPARQFFTALPRLILFALIVIEVSAVPSLAQELTGKMVKDSIKAGVEFLRTAQRPKGNWPEVGQYTGGSTALALLALRNCGVPANDQAVVGGAEYLRQIPNQWTYVVSLKAQALAAVDPVRYRKEIDAAAKWLISAQLDDGGWSYGSGGPRSDHSNSQFALLGLHEAARAGSRISEMVWLRAEKEWIGSQLRDGGWGYIGQIGRSTGSMTSAGIASLFITGNQLAGSRERGYTAEGYAPDCGRYRTNRAMLRGIDWLARNFVAGTNPPQGDWNYYYMYGVERVGVLLGEPYLGQHDWYREGAAFMVRQQQVDGSWQDRQGLGIVDTTFALLFLGKGHRSILFNKLKWGKTHEWEQDRNDIKNLVAFIDDKLGEAVGWQVVPIEAKLEDWLAAPILYMNGHVFPELTPEEVAKFTEFIQQGGSLLMEACCSKAEFRRGFEQFAKKAFPDCPLRKLEAEHPVFHSHYEIDPKTEIYGIDMACRTSVIFLPRDVSCLWEQAKVPRLSEAAFQLGTNIAAYFAGRDKLRDRLDAVHVVKREADNKGPVSGSALQIAQIMHNGDWKTDVRTIPNIVAHLRDKADVDVISQALPLRCTDPALRSHPISYMTGHYSFRLTREEMAALREYLRRGGFLFADACCGRTAFDISFREMCAELFPEHKLEPLPENHPVRTGSPGYPLAQVRYRPAVLAEKPDFNKLVLEGIDLDGRTVIVYSPYSVGCPVDGHSCFSCKGLETEDAIKLFTNIILYPLSY